MRLTDAEEDQVLWRCGRCGHNSWTEHGGMLREDESGCDLCDCKLSEQEAVVAATARIKSDAYAAGLAARVSTATGDTEALLDAAVEREEDAEARTALAEKWLGASKAARAFEHHWPADCLAEAAHMLLSTATGVTTGDDLRDRVERVLADEQLDAFDLRLANASRDRLQAIVDNPALSDHDWIETRRADTRGALVALLASSAPVVSRPEAEVKAEVWNEAHDKCCPRGQYCPGHPNPYADVPNVARNATP